MWGAWNGRLSFRHAYDLGTRDALFLPLRPAWPGFAINTLLYGVLLWLPIASPFAPRRLVRIGRGLCPGCAYPRGASPMCTECGKMLPKRLGLTNRSS